MNTQIGRNLEDLPGTASRAVHFVANFSLNFSNFDEKWLLNELDELVMNHRWIPLLVRRCTLIVMGRKGMKIRISQYKTENIATKSI